jgi:hypothetical protein
MTILVVYLALVGTGVAAALAWRRVLYRPLAPAQNSTVRF